MLNIKRFQELCRRVEEEREPTKLHETRQQMIEMLEEQELDLLSRERHHSERSDGGSEHLQICAEDSANRFGKKHHMHNCCTPT